MLLSKDAIENTLENGRLSRPITVASLIEMPWPRSALSSNVSCMVCLHVLVVCVYTERETDRHTHMHTHRHTHAHARAHTHTHTQTYIEVRATESEKI